MVRRIRILTLTPALCAIFIVLETTVLRPSGVSDFTRGATVGVFLGISICALVARHRLLHSR